MYRTTKFNLNRLINILVFFFIFVTFFTRIEEGATVLRIALNIIIIVFIIFLLHKNTFRIIFTSELFFYFAFLVTAALSIYQSKNIIDSAFIVVKMSGVFIMIFFIAQYIFFTGKYHLIFYSYIITSIIALIYYALHIVYNGYYTYLFQGVNTDQLRYLMFIGNNPNYVGMTFSYALFFLIVEDKIKKAWCKYLLISFLFIGILITGSRKALLSVAILLFLYFFIRSENKLRLTIYFLIVLSIVALSLIYIPVIYNTIGWRLIGMFSVFSDEIVYESSANYRFKMLIEGLELIKQKPLLGYGIDSYRYVQNIQGVNTYSHNNFIEITVGVGVIGLICYSMFFVGLLVKNLKLEVKKKSIVLPILINLLIMGSASVQYRSPDTFLLVIMSMVFNYEFLESKRIDEYY